MVGTARSAAAAVLVGAAVLALPAAGTAQALGAPGTGTAGAGEAAACSTPWGSTGESAGVLSTAALRGVRSGQHACSDRWSSTWAGRGWATPSATWLPCARRAAVTSCRCAAGRACRWTCCTRRTTPVAGRPTSRRTRELAPTAGYRTLQQSAWGGSVEGQTTVGVGVRARLPFRAFALHTTTGSELVVDVAHRW